MCVVLWSYGYVDVVCAVWFVQFLVECIGLSSVCSFLMLDGVVKICFGTNHLLGSMVLCHGGRVQQLYKPCTPHRCRMQQR